MGSFVSRLEGDSFVALLHSFSQSAFRSETRIFHGGCIPRELGQIINHGITGHASLEDTRDLGVGVSSGILPRKKI